MVKSFEMAVLCAASASALVIFAALPSASFAQESQASGIDTGTSAAEGSLALEEVVVTAQRRSENVQKASVAIEVISGEQMQEAGIVQAADLTTVVPGVQVGAGGPAAQVYIRGVGDYGFTAVANPAVAFNIDGVYVARTQAIAGSFFDLERVEVLKGPQGTLYGRNASGGAINLMPNRPRLGAFGGYAQVGIESRDGYSTGSALDGHSTEAALNVPVNDRLALRGSVQLVDRDGYLSDGSNDDVHQSGRLQALWEPNPDVSVLLWGSYAHVGGEGTSYALLDTDGNPASGRPGTAGLDPWTGISSPQANALLQSGAPFPGAIRQLTPEDIHQDLDLWNVHAELNWNLGFATLTVIPAYQHADMNYAVVPTLPYASVDFNGEPEQSSATSIEARLASDTDALKWVTGVFYYDEDQKATTSVSTGRIQNISLNVDNATESYAAFGQATYSLTQNLRVIGGLRYTHERKRQSGARYAVAPFAGCPPAAGACVISPLTGTVSVEETNWKAGVEYDLSEENMLYSTLSTGFKSGGLPAAIAAPFRPEGVTAYELGSRNRFFGGSLQVNAEAFYWKYKDHQEQVIGPDDLGIVSALIRNAGSATSYGANLDVVYRLTSVDQIRTGVEYNDARYDSFAFEQPLAFLPAGQTGCRVTPTGEFGAVGPVGRVDCSRFQLARAPSWTGLASYTHAFEFANGSSLQATADLTFASARWLTVDFIPNAKAPGYVLPNANLTYAPASGTWSLSAFVRNITNEEVYSGGVQSPFVPSVLGANIGPPRTYGVRLHVDF